MELVLPKNYVEVTEEELMYLDGGRFGKNWWNSRGTVATLIDVAAVAITGWGAVASATAVRNILRSNIGKRLTSGIALAISRQVGTAAGNAFAAALDLGLVCVGGSIGSIAAYGLDRIDGRLDGYVFA